MPEQLSAAEKLNKLKGESAYIHLEIKTLKYNLNGYSQDQIAADEDLSSVQARLDELTNQARLIKNEIEQLEIMAVAEEKIEVIRSLMSASQPIIDGLKDGAGEIAGQLLDAFIDLRDGIDDQLARLSKISAQNRFRQFADLQQAGFNESQAFMLTLASVHPINWSEMAQKGDKVVAARSRKS